MNNPTEKIFFAKVDYRLCSGGGSLDPLLACAALGIAQKYFTCTILSELHRALTGSEAPNKWMTGSKCSSLPQC